MPRTDAFFSNMKKNNILVTARDVIYNKYVLYVVFVAALFDLLYSAVKQDYLYCILFILVGFVIAFFNKNMTVILTLTIATANIIKTAMGGNNLNVEGFSEDKDDEKKSTTATTAAATKTAAATTAPKKKTTEESATSSEKPKTTPSSTAAANKTTSPSALIDTLKDHAIDLQELQQKIIKGFEQIEPHMDRAETLIGTIQETAQTIQGMRNQQ